MLALKPLHPASTLLIEPQVLLAEGPLGDADSLVQLVGGCRVGPQHTVFLCAGSTAQG